MVSGHRIAETIESGAFAQKIRGYEGRIFCTPHTFFRLSEQQRRVLTCETLIEILLNEAPRLAGVQRNGCFTAFYAYREKRFLRVVLDLKPDRAHIVTFVIEDRIPRI